MSLRKFDRIEWGLVIAICLASMFLLASLVRYARSGERLPCFAEPQGRDWHYRTKVPGFNGDVRGDRCWFNGPSMKPRDELYWPSPPAPEPLPLNVGEPMQLPWPVEYRWIDPKGWTHQE